MSALPEGVEPATLPPARPSALGVLVRRRPGRWEVLLGLRGRRARFMPGHLAFPGGGLDPADGEGDTAWRRCASRELAEEAGLDVAPEAWSDLGERVTPPLFRVRFRTRFFLAEVAPSVEPPAPPSPDEIEALAFHAPDAVLGRWARGEVLVPPPVLPLLRALERARDEVAPSALAARLAAVNDLERDTPRIEFLPDVWLVPLASRTLPPATHTNAWMPGASRFVVLDPGSDDPEELALLRGVVERRRAEGARLEAIVLTHGHPDHVAGAVAAAAQLGVPVRASRPVLAALSHRLGGSAGAPIGEGDVLDLGGMTLRAMETPGHAPGHLAFHVPEREAALVGDLVSGLSTILVDPHEGDMASLLASLARISALHCKTLLPGHGAPVPGRAAREAIEHRRHREAAVLDAVRAGATSLAEIAAAAYADTPQAPPPLRERQTLAHLIDLERRGVLPGGGQVI